MKKWVFIFTLAALTSQTSFAKDCHDTATTNYDMIHCQCTDFKKADQELNSVYKKLLKKYKSDKGAIERIKIAQRAWLDFRDKHMESFYHRTESSMRLTTLCECSQLEKITLDRVVQLKLMLNGYPEGDICQPQIASK